MTNAPNPRTAARSPRLRTQAALIARLLTAAPWAAPIGAIGVLLSPAASAPAEAAPSGPPSALQRHVALAPNDRAAAIAALEAATTNGSERDRAWAAALLGEQLRLSGRPDEARRRFTAARGAGVTEVFATCELGLALLEVEGRPAAALLKTLRTIAPSAVPDTQNADRYAALALEAATSGQDAASYARKALDAAAGDAPVRAAIQARLSAAGISVGGTAATAPPPPPAPARATLADAVAAWRAGDPGRARAIAEPIAAQDAGREASEARALLQAMSQPPTPEGRIGVLLPSTGRYAGVAEPVRTAILDGWGQSANVDRLVFVDTLGTAEGALAALQELVEVHNVQGVLGPLTSDETMPVVQEADRLGVPLVTMSQVLDDASPWPWVFQAWLTPRAQIDALLDHVMDTEGRRSFAILAPENAYGTRAAEEFTRQVTARGGAVMLRADYPENSKTLGDFVLPLKPAAGAPSWEGVFVPDNAAAAAAAANALTFHDVSVGAFRAGDTPAAPLLGLSGWNRADLVTAGGPGVQAGHFTDIFVAAPAPTTGLLWYPTDAWRTFHDRMLALTTRAPTPIEALASEAANLLAQATRARPEDRWDLRAALLNLKPVGTLTEVRGFDPATRVALREVTVFEITPSGFQRVAP